MCLLQIVLIYSSILAGKSNIHFRCARGKSRNMLHVILVNIVNWSIIQIILYVSDQPTFRLVM
jgi:hypothetical protein